MTKACLSFFLFAIVFAFSASTSIAAAPDGAGPWADSVVSSSQGLRKDGSAVLPARSNPTAAVGVAENDVNETSFFSLGFNGSITLGFDNGISGGTLVVEATNLGYPAEKAKVEVSPDGTTWTVAGTVTQDGEVSLPSSVTCAKYVRLTDQSNPADFSDTTADGYDVDGVKSLGQSCQVVTPTPTPPCDVHDKECCAATNVTQNNTTVSHTVIVASSNSGGNTNSGNTGGNNTIKTGKSSNKVSVTTVGGNNKLETGKNCCGGGNTNVEIKDNGAFSKNTVKIKK